MSRKKDSVPHPRTPEASLPTLVAGQSLYLVVEIGSSDVGWELEERIVLQVMRCMFSLDRGFRNRVNTRLVHRSQIGRSMFATPEEALESFSARQQQTLRDCVRGQAVAEFALAWCEAKRRLVVDPALPSGCAGSER